MKLKNDKYRKARGGYSRLLEIKCSFCTSFLCNYQKDGPGILKRMYLDRIYDKDFAEIKSLVCPACGSVLGNLGIYEKESRPAYFLILGSVSKKIVNLAISMGKE